MFDERMKEWKTGTGTIHAQVQLQYWERKVQKYLEQDKVSDRLAINLNKIQTCG